MSEASELNRNLESRQSDKFYVNFLELEANYSNFLAAHLVSIDRPIINFEATEMFEKGRKSSYQTILRFDPIGLIFKDDVGGLVWNLLHSLAKKQNDHTSEPFELKIETLDNEHKVVDSYKLLRCNIQTLGKTPLSYSDSSESLIDCTIVFENLCFSEVC